MLYTPRLGLKKPEGKDNFSRQDFLDTWDALDANPGAFVCTSTTNPAGWGANQVGRLIFETDTGLVKFFNSSHVFQQVLQTVTDQLQNNINSVDSTLQGNINTVTTNLNNEISNRTGLTNSLQTQVNNEVTNRSNGDSTLQGNINSEITNRQNADSNLQGQINNEVTNRTNGDNSLQGQINNLSSGKFDANRIGWCSYTIPANSANASGQYSVTHNFGWTPSALFFTGYDNGGGTCEYVYGTANNSTATVILRVATGGLRTTIGTSGYTVFILGVH